MSKTKSDFSCKLSKVLEHFKTFLDLLFSIMYSILSVGYLISIGI